MRSPEVAQQIVREVHGMCGDLSPDGQRVCIREMGHEDPHPWDTIDTQGMPDQCCDMWPECTHVLYAAEAWQAGFATGRRMQRPFRDALVASGGFTAPRGIGNVYDIRLAAPIPKRPPTRREMQVRRWREKLALRVAPWLEDE